APKLSGYSTPVQFQEAFEIEEALDQASAAQNVRLQSYAATGIAMLVAGLVILSSLSMGVNERIRQYAVLRAVALSRGQVGWLIVLEGLSLGVFGLLAGLMASWMLLQMVGRLFSQVLYHGIGIGVWSLALATVAMLGGAVIASLIPAYRAMRVRPLDAMAPRPAMEVDSRLLKPSVLLGLSFLLVNPLLTFVFPPQTEKMVYASMAIGFVTMAIGFVLLAPLLVRAVDAWCSPLVSRVFAIDPKLLASQLSSRLWRSVGAAVSLAFGLGLFLSIHVWGWTMLEAFIPGEWAPDALAAISPGLSAEQADAVTQLKGVHAERCSPLVVEQPRLLHDLTGSAERASITRQDNVIVVGIDPQISLGGNEPLLNVQWVEGNPQDAVERMRLGRAC
ncbi:MAG: FtsX-like permease family protein, partial [Planctomycetales bacterium]|nr:FtsX-like permease family protein [Planctomycetales bacterium]